MARWSGWFGVAGFQLVAAVECGVVWLMDAEPMGERCDRSKLEKIRDWALVSKFGYCMGDQPFENSEGIP